MEGNGFQRSVAPWLVIGGVNGQVVANKQVVIGGVEDTVVPVKIGGCEDYLHGAAFLIGDAQAVHHVQHTVVVGFVELVGNHRHGKGSVVGGVGCQSLLQVVSGSGNPSGHLDEGQYGAVRRAGIDGLSHGFDKHINALVLEFIPSAGGHYHCVVREGDARERIGYAEYALTCCFAACCEGGSLWYKVGLKAVHENGIAGAVEQLGTFTPRHIAHRGEAVYMVGCLPFDAVLGFHVELLCHLGAVVGPQVLVEGLVVASDAAPDAGGMGGEDGGNGRHVLAYVQGSQAGHPFVGLIHHMLLALLQAMVVETLHHEGGCIGEHVGFVVIAVAVEAVHLKIVPGICIEGVTLRIVGLEVYQHHTGLSGDVPPSCADVQAFFFRLLAPGLPQPLVFQKQGIAVCISEIGSDKNYTVAQHILHGLGPC